MMDHDFYKDKISAFFDGELKNEEAVMVSDHFEECQLCKKEYERLQRFDELVQENSKLSEEEYWEKSAQRIESALEADKKIETKITEVGPFAWKGLGWKLTTAAASIALITFIAIYEKDMSDEMYELTEPESVIVEHSIQETAVVDDELNYDEANQEEPLEGSSNSDQKPQKLEEKPDAQTPLVPLADKFVDESKDVNIALKRVKGGKEDVVTVTGESPLVVRDKTTTIDLVKSEDLKAIPERNEENEFHDAEIGTDALDDEILTLSQWREKRDKLQSSNNEVNMTGLKQSFDKTKISSSASLIKNDSIKVVNLLECYYNIALLTDNSLEYDQAIESIEKYLKSDKDRYKKQAELYIEKLSKEKKKK
jgi:hypothetical protein